MCFCSQVTRSTPAYFERSDGIFLAHGDIGVQTSFDDSFADYIANLEQIVQLLLLGQWSDGLTDGASAKERF
jgi:hypothetical protein